MYKNVEVVLYSSGPDDRSAIRQRIAAAADRFVDLRGLSEEQLQHLFEPFNRLGAERLPVVGHGLGLSIARTLTQAMGGTLQVQSVPGEGSRFVLELPLGAWPPGQGGG